jgi:hypothetical protein
MSEITIPNISDYDLKTVNNVLIITPKTTYLSKDEFLNNDFTSSKILECEITTHNNILISNNLNYTKILHLIWKTMTSSKILQNTTFNMKLTNENGEKGYVWYDYLKLSIQSKNANNSIKEIFNMIEITNYTITVKIQLSNNDIINYKTHN